MKLNIGLRSLSIPLFSRIKFSRNNMDKIGANCELPGSTNQKEPKIPIKNGVKKNLINLFLTIFINK